MNHRIVIIYISNQRPSVTWPAESQGSLKLYQICHFPDSKISSTFLELSVSRQNVLKLNAYTFWLLQLYRFLSQAGAKQTAGITKHFLHWVQIHEGKFWPHLLTKRFYLYDRKASSLIIFIIGNWFARVAVGGSLLCYGSNSKVWTATSKFESEEIWKNMYGKARRKVINRMRNRKIAVRGIPIGRKSKSRKKVLAMSLDRCIK